MRIGDRVRHSNGMTGMVVRYPNLAIEWDDREKAVRLWGFWAPLIVEYPHQVTILEKEEQTWQS